MTLVGRVDELAGIDAALSRLGTRSWVTEVLGEPGIGKTRLLDEVRVRAAARSHLVLTGRSTQFEQSVPFAPIVEALAGHVGKAGVDGPQRELLASLFPELGPAAQGPVIERYRLYRAVRILLETLAEPAGLVLIMDDLHWVDDGTAELLAHLLRHPPAAPVLLVVAYRPAQLSAATAAALVQAGVDRINLAPLSQEAFAELLGPGVSRARCEDLHRSCGGNPFYLEVLTKTAGDSADAALRGELDGLSPQVRLVARAAAVAGDPFEPTLVAAIAGLTTTSTLDALDDLLARDLIRTSADERKLRFRHPLVRQTAYLDGGEDWWTGAHRRAAAELARRAAPVVIRAHHIALAAQLGDLDAIRSLMRAAALTMPTSPATAAHWLRVALDLLPPGQPELRLQLLTLTGYALGVTGKLTESRDLLYEVLRELPADAVWDRANAATQCAMAERLLGNYSAAREVLLAELRTGAESVQTAGLKLEIAYGTIVRGEPGEGASLVEEVLGYAGMIGDRAMASAALSLLSWSSYTTADLDAAVRYCTSAARLFDGLSDGELSARIDTTAWLCHAERFVDRFDDALRHTDRCIALARATGRSHVLTYLLSHRAMVLRWLGRFPEAAQAAEDGAEVALLMDSGPLQEVALQTGNRIRLAAGGTGHVDQVLDALGGPELPGLDRLSRPIKYEELARADVAAGHFARAEKWAYSAEFTAHPALPTRIGAADLAWAHVLLAGDRPAEARVRAQSSVAAFEVRGNRFDVGRAYLVWGRASASLGETADAISRLEQAETVFTECGVPGLAAQAARDLRSLGRRATGGAELTARERQIAELVADGSSNREIAEVLVISERTVGTHLSRIYAKLGISSRAALAAERARGR